MILYKGPSAHNGVPIVVIGTFASKNKKTGPMVSTWILVDPVEPIEATRSPLLEAGVCGTCPLKSPRRCYVALHQAPTQVWRHYKMGCYEAWNPARWDAAVYATGLRMGSYGDPAMAPLELWERLAQEARIYTGYTHQWRSIDPAQRSRWQRLLMASTDTPKDTFEATAQGWSTYSIGQGQGIQCPNNKNTGVTCLACGLCNGTRKGQRHVWTEPIGTGQWAASRRSASSPLSSEQPSGCLSKSPRSSSEVASDQPL